MSYLFLACLNNATKDKIMATSEIIHNAIEPPKMSDFFIFLALSSLTVTAFAFFPLPMLEQDVHYSLYPSILPYLYYRMSAQL